jgi:hypothetical protein
VIARGSINQGVTRACGAHMPDLSVLRDRKLKGLGNVGGRTDERSIIGDIAQSAWHPMSPRVSGAGGGRRNRPPPRVFKLARRCGGCQHEQHQRAANRPGEGTPADTSRNAAAVPDEEIEHLTLEVPGPGSMEDDRRHQSRG